MNYIITGKKAVAVLESDGIEALVDAIEEMNLSEWDLIESDEPFETLTRLLDPRDYSKLDEWQHRVLRNAMYGEPLRYSDTEKLDYIVDFSGVDNPETHEEGFTVSNGIIYPL